MEQRKHKQELEAIVLRWHRLWSGRLKRRSPAKEQSNKLLQRWGGILVVYCSRYISLYPIAVPTQAASVCSLLRFPVVPSAVRLANQIWA